MPRVTTCIPLCFPRSRKRLVAFFAAAASTLAGGALHAATSKEAALVQRGAYLADVGHCVSCHTVKGGEPYAGGLYMPTPFGEISTPNITPDRKTGIGNWTDEQFYRAMHEGIGHEGEYLYPVMPFPWYTIATRDDVAAIRAYLTTIPAVSKPREPNKLVFPANVRTSLLAWREVFFKPRDFKPDPAQTAEVNRGNYLVNGLGHCGQCHNGRPAFGATSEHRQVLAGGVIDNWYAPNISSDVRDGIGNWSKRDLATYLKSGAAPNGNIAAGPMAEVIKTTSKMTDADLLAMAAYLKTTKPQAQPEGKQYELFAGKSGRGGEAYLSFCASCHGVQGEGLKGVIPSLKGNGAVTAGGPQSVINVVLGGLPARQGYAPMLAIGAGMTDTQVADVTNYIRQNWGNKAAPTAESGMVAKLRGELATAMNPQVMADCDRNGVSARAARIEQQVTAQDAMSGLAARADEEISSEVPALVKTARSVDPRAPAADLVNGLTSGYCRALLANTALEPQQRALRLGHFSELVYSSATGQKLQ